jgi:hypothetical protein
MKYDAKESLISGSYSISSLSYSPSKPSPNSL